MPEAEALIRRYLDTPRAKPELHVDYARALVEQGRISDAHAQLNALTRQQPDYPEGWLVQGALLADERRDDQAAPALRHFLQLADAQASQPGLEREGPRAQARLMLAGIAERRGDLAEAEQLLGQIDSPEQILAVQSQRARMLAHQGKLDEARQAIRSAPERELEDARNKLLAEAQLLREHHQPEQSYQLLADALTTDPDDEALLYDAALAAERAGRLHDMERLLRHLIAIAPQNASAYNALGYSLADRGERLKEAKALIEKAVELSPDDHFIQDSLGWVEFRLGRAQEARRLIEAAYKKRPDPEIAAHLGEVLWTLGERDAALAVWREGQRLDPDNETLIKTLQRLKVTP
jgi:predicted Zn-dependent protease